MRPTLCALLLAAATGTATAQTPTGIPRLPLPASPLALEGPARAGEYLGDVGRRAALFGDETGGFEAWTWPVKLVRDLPFSFRIPDYDQPIEAAKVARRVILHPAYKTIVYSHPTFTVRAHVMAALEEPGALILRSGQGPPRSCRTWTRTAASGWSMSAGSPTRRGKPWRGDSCGSRPRQSG